MCQELFVLLRVLGLLLFSIFLLFVVGIRVNFVLFDLGGIIERVSPLDYGFFLSTGTDNIISVGGKSDICDLRGVGGEFHETLVLSRAGVTEKFYLREIVSGDNDVTFGGSVDAVNVETHGARGPNSLNVPAHYAGVSFPPFVFQNFGFFVDLRGCLV